MCLIVYIGSQNQLPLIQENEFYLREEHDADKGYTFVKNLLSSNFLYTVGSFLGCSCGFSYGAWSEIENDHLKRIKSVTNFMNYLRSNLKDNKINLFCTEWTQFLDTYDVKDFNLNSVNKREFEFEEDIILNIQN